MSPSPMSPLLLPHWIFEQLSSVGVVKGTDRTTRTLPDHPDLSDLPEPALAALHLAVVRERERRLHEPDKLVLPDTAVEADR